MNAATEHGSQAGAGTFLFGLAYGLGGLLYAWLAREVDLRFGRSFGVYSGRLDACVALLGMTTAGASLSFLFLFHQFEWLGLLGRHRLAASLGVGLCTISLQAALAACLPESVGPWTVPACAFLAPALLLRPLSGGGRPWD